MEEQEIEAALRRAAELFDDARYHAAHEVLDEVWEASGPAESDFFKGLIQACIALHHHAQGNPDGARKLYAGHRQYLAPFLPRHRGLDVAAFLASMQAALGALVRARPGGSRPSTGSGGRALCSGATRNRRARLPSEGVSDARSTPTPLALGRGDRGWPAGLDEIEAAPERLWVRGRAGLLAREPHVAIVGTRAPTPYGEAQAARFARTLALEGVVVTSGLARGIDAAAHVAALECGGATVAVLGCGVDRPWPAGPLAERVAREGALVSELRPGTPPRRHHFPRRNRLISGLARVVLVVEAAHASGSLITARWAADQGRTVMALPGRVDHPMSRGCHRLLREGAQLAESPDDVLEELGLRGSPAARARGKAPREVPPRERALLEALRGETLSSDELAERTAHELTAVLTALVSLELEGLVARGPGGLWRLVEGG